jgi:O-antigen ligase
MIDKLIFYGLIFLVAFTPLAFGTTEPWSIAVMELGGLLLLVLFGIKLVGEARLRVQSPVLLLVFILFVLFVFGQTLPLAGTALNINALNLKYSTSSLYPHDTGNAWLKLVVYLIIFLIVSHYFAYDAESGRQRLSRFVNFIIFFSFGLSLFAIVQHFAFNGKLYWFRELSQGGSPFGPFVNRNHYAGYMELTVPLALGLLLAKGIEAERRPLYIFMSAVMSASLFLSSSRGGAMSFLGQLLFLTFLLRLAGARRLLSFSNLVIFGVLLCLVSLFAFWLGAGGLLDRVSSLSNPDGEQVYHGRLSVWSATLRIAKDFPLAGTGLGTFPFVYPVYKSENTDLKYTEAHNDYLQIFSETGMIGAGLLLLFGILAMGKALRLIRRAGPRSLTAIRIGALTSCFGLLLHSVTDFNLQIPSNALLFFVLAAIATMSVPSSEFRVSSSMGIQLETRNPKLET